MWPLVRLTFVAALVASVTLKQFGMTCLLVSVSGLFERAWRL